MAKGDVFHALKHAHRQKILRTLRRRPRTYSTLLAKVDPDGSGTGRFNYHLKVLKDAGLVEVDETLYRPTANGFAALQLLAQAPRGTATPPRRRVQLTIIGSLIGVGSVGLLLLLSIVLAPAVLQAPETDGRGGWNIPIFVSDKARVVRGPQIAVDPSGNAIAIWTQEEAAFPSDRNLWANRFVSGVGWHAPTLVEGDASGYARSPMLAIDPAGNAWAVWDQNAGDPFEDPSISPLVEGHNVWTNRFVPGAGWGEAALVATDALLGDIALDTGGALTIVWNEVSGRGYAIYADRLVPEIGSVGATRIIDDVHRLGVQLAVGTDGSAMAVWSDGDGVYASRYVPNEGWGLAVRIGVGSSPSGGAPAVAMWRFDQAVTTARPEFVEGKAVTVWHSDSGDTEGIYAAYFVPRSGWSEAVPIGLDDGSLDMGPQVVVDGHGIAIAAWGQAHPTDAWVDLVVARGALGMGFEVPIRIAEVYGITDFALAIEPGGSAAIGYGDGNGVFAVRYVPERGEEGFRGWDAPAQIGSETCVWGLSCGNPDVAVDHADNVIAVWAEYKISTPGGALASRFGPPTPFDELVLETLEQLEQNQIALGATSARLATMTAVSLSLLVAFLGLVGVLFVVYWNPRRGPAEHGETSDESGEPPNPGG